MSQWIASRQALRLAKEAGLTNGDLLEWARLGRLRARAESGIFSSDDADLEGNRETRQFPAEPPSNEIELLTKGPWPDILADFWKEVPLKEVWGAGTFIARVTYWDGHNQRESEEIIELLDVKFNKGDLEALLSRSAEPTSDLKTPKKTWQQQRVTPRQAAAMEFIDIIARKPPKELEGKSARHRMYCEWHRKQSGQQKHEALGRTDFNKCADRYDDGWRIVGSKWVHHP